MKNAKGFGVFGLFIVLAFIAIVGMIGWRVYSEKQPIALDNIPAVPYKAKKLVAIGDISCDLSYSNPEPNTCQQDATYQLAEQLKPDFVLGLGDLQYNDGALSKFQQSFAKSWGNLTNIFYPAPGNHEYATPGAQGYIDYFAENQPKDPAVDVARGYYSFDVGKWHVVSLNSNCRDIGGCGADSDQMKWLEQDLTDNPAGCTLAFWHHPRFSSGRYAAIDKGITDTFWEKLTAHKADVILNGHDHLYERFAPQLADGAANDNGIRQFTVGTGGRSLYKRQQVQPTSQSLIDDKYGVLVLTLYEEAYKWEFVSTDGAMLDSGDQHCSK